MVNTIDDARTPAELAEWLRLWARAYEVGVDYLDDNDAGQLAEAVERVCAPFNAAALREALKQCGRALEKAQCSSAFQAASTGADYITAALSSAHTALAAPARNCDLYQDETDAQLAFLNDVWLISVDKNTMLEKDKFENWTEQMKTRYGRWLYAPAEGGAK